MFTLTLARYLAMGWSVTDADGFTLALAHYGRFHTDDTYWVLLVEDNGDGTFRIQTERMRRDTDGFGLSNRVALDVRTSSPRSPHSLLMDVRRSTGAVR